MVELNSVCDTVWMLVVAFGLGLLGGVAAAFIEWRKSWEKSEEKPKGKRRDPGWSAFSCIFLGGVAAVAVLYFIAPTETIPNPSDPGETQTSYDLVKLVALSLIVGSAGTTILQALQGRVTAQLAAQEATQVKETTQDTAGQVLGDVTTQAKDATVLGVEAAATQIQAELQKKEALSPKEAEKIVGKLADEASQKVADALAPQVERAQQLINTAAGDAPPG